MKLPNKLFGIDTEEAYQRVLSREKNEPEKQVEPTIQSSNFPGYIYVPSINLFVAKEKILHSKNWEQTHQELQKQNQRMLTILQFVSFINYLKSVPSYHPILDEILTVRDPWRSEWLDAYFEKRK